MRRKVLLFTALVFSVGSVLAQGEMDAYKLSQTDLTGTARSVSMGGAFGALGGDISGIAINPAGIGVYRSSEIVTTMNFQNTKTTIESNFNKIDDSKFKFNFDNLAFVTAFPLYNDDVPYLNFGFSYNRVKNFDRKYSMGIQSNNTIANYMAYRANGITFKDPDYHNELWIDPKDDLYPLDNYDWLSVFGYNSGLIGLGNDNIFREASTIPGTVGNDLFVREKGSISTYDFNVGTTISDIVSFGLTISVTDLKYRLYSEFSEYYGNNNTYAYLDNDIRTDGTGFQVSAGVIVKPVNELRIGLAYHSPTWYNMTDTYAADFNFDLEGIGIDNDLWDPMPFYNYDYKLRTPDRWTASLAGVIGQTAIISADYEYTNYGGNMKLFNEYGDPLNHDANVDIKNHFKGASTLRLGAEVRFTPQFSGRVGYQWRQSPMKKDFKNNTGIDNPKLEPMTVGAVTQYTLDGDTNYITYGLGYRFNKNIYADIAFVMKTQKSDIYTYYGSEKSEWKDNTFQGLLTLGYRF